MQPTPRSLILDLLSTAARGAMPVAALVATAELFALPQNRVRVALARLLAAGLVERDQRGRYRMGAGAAAINRQVTSWRDLGQRLRPWKGAWIGVHTGGLRGIDRAAARRRDRALRLLGFRSPDPGLELRPDNLVEGVAGVGARLQELGLPEGASVFRISDLDSGTECRARALWDVAGLCAAYRTTRLELEASRVRLPTLAPERGMAESFLIGGRAIRQLVLDPLLPDAIAPPDERDALIAEMRDYDEVGRAVWAPFMKRWRTGRGAAPADTRVADAAWLAAAGGGA